MTIDDTKKRERYIYTGNPSNNLIGVRGCREIRFFFLKVKTGGDDELHTECRRIRIAADRLLKDNFGPSQWNLFNSTVISPTIVLARNLTVRVLLHRICGITVGKDPVVTRHGRAPKINRTEVPGGDCVTPNPLLFAIRRVVC